MALVSNCLAAGIKLSYEPVWPGIVNRDGYTPIRVELKNSGPNAFGILKITTLSGQIAYPVELPTNSDKIITAYLSDFNSYDTPKLSFESNLAPVNQTIELRNELNNRTTVVGVISSESGLLASFKPKDKATQVGIATEIKPEQAPDRSIGYDCLDMLVLSQGAERLSEGAIFAIQRYVLNGGKLLIIGGASSPWVSDPRWGAVLPIQAKGTFNTNFPKEILGARLDVAGRPVTITDSELANGGEVVTQVGGHPVLARKDVGLGKVYFVAFDLFSGDIQKSPSRDALVRVLGEDGQPLKPENEYQPWDDNIGNRLEGSPFKFQIPPTWKIISILSGFFLIVIPINFLILNKLNKRELAWITVPVISVLFSFLIFLTASSLYQAKKSRHTTGLVLCTEGSGQALFSGTQQIFLPMAGTYDLGFQSVEGASDYRAMRGWTMGGSLMEGGPEYIDIGQVVVPKLEATSLTFRDFSLTQAIPFAGKLGLSYSSAKVTGGWQLSGVITNDTPLFIKSPVLRFSGQNIKISDLRPGSRVLFKGQSNEDSSTQGYEYTGSNMALVGRVEGLQIGSNVGTEVDDKSGPVLIYTFSQAGPK